MLRWYQQEAVEAAWLNIRLGNNPCIVAPTGAGKSWIIAEICRQAIENWNGRLLVVAHRKELLEQNAEKIQHLLTEHEVGIYSAGLNSRDVDAPVVCCGIQSVYRKAFDFGRRDILIVDEAHLIPMGGDGMYLQFIEKLRIANPHLRVIGLTATPYRTDDGDITKGQMLDSICYEVPIRRLIEEGYLTKLVTPGVDRHIDSSQIQIRGGEFVARSMQDAFIERSLIHSCTNEIIEKCEGRKSVLVFAAGVEHAEKIAEALEDKSGEPVEVITGDTKPLMRQAAIDAFRTQKLRWLVNCNVLTTGFDAPCIDAIAVVRCTCSPALFAQMVGRGFRVHAGKEDCLILDFGENVSRHGQLDDPSYGKRKKSRDLNSESSAPMKVCDQCGFENAIACVFCGNCGCAFPEKEVSHEAEASDEEILLPEPDPPKWYPVKSWSCMRWVKKRRGREAETVGLATFRVDYLWGESGDLRSDVWSEWLCFDHDPGSWPRGKAIEWWRLHSESDIPSCVDEAVAMFNGDACRMPCEILVDYSGKFPRIIDRKFDCERPLEYAPAYESDGFDDEDDIPF